MKEIKDYLHFYLGCRVKIEDDEVNKGGISLLMDVSIGGYCRLQGRLGLWPIDSIKPILRQLSDMTKKEGRILDKMAERQADKIVIIKTCNVFNGIRVNTAEALVYLLSKHFDLFQLIEPGLAIDAATLK